jgi:hypothetical protein
MEEGPQAHRLPRDDQSTGIDRPRAHETDPPSNGLKPKANVGCRGKGMNKYQIWGRRMAVALGFLREARRGLCPFVFAESQLSRM